MQHKRTVGRAHIGVRNIKTAATATLVAAIYFLLNRNPAFACIGVIFGTCNDMANSWLNGGNRLFGTIFGGVLGMGLFTLYVQVYPQGGYYPLMLLFLFIGVVLLILISQWFKWPGAIQPGGVMLCIMLFSQPVESYMTYSINRIVDTAIGVVVALLVNWLLPRERIQRILQKLSGGRYQPEKNPVPERKK